MKVLTFLTLILSVLPSYSATEVKTKATKPAIQIDAIEYKVFDRQKNVFVESGKQSDPYGLQNDLFVTVKLSKLGENEVTLKVTATTPRTDDEARGVMNATSQSSTSTVTQPDSTITSIVTVPFFFKYVCNPMTIQAEIMGQNVKKEIKVLNTCAE